VSRRLASLALVIALLSAFVVPQAAAAQVPNPGGLSVPITAPVAGGTFNGFLQIVRFDRQGGQLVAFGRVTGAVTDAAGAVIRTLPAAGVPVGPLPVTSITATCNILTLVLGPLDLDLLGLIVHLDRVELTIDADATRGLLGQLLGGLLCSTNVSQLLVNVLNQVLGRL
jgi:hypothetical protein